MAGEPLIVKCFLGKQTKIVPQGWDLISKVKHPELTELFQELVFTLQQPEIVVQSKHDLRVFLYYRKLGKYYYVAVSKHYNGDGFLITAYMSSKTKGGKVIYEAKNKV